MGEVDGGKGDTCNTFNNEDEKKGKWARPSVGGRLGEKGAGHVNALCWGRLRSRVRDLVLQ